MKVIKKTEIEKKQKRIKIETDPGGNVSAQYRNEPVAHLAKPEAVPSSLSPLADWWDPPVISLLPLIPLPLTGNGRDLLPLQFLKPPCPFRSLTAPIRWSPPPLASPLPSREIAPPGRPNRSPESSLLQAKRRRIPVQ
jgi:hypothetical protein